MMGNSMAMSRQRGDSTSLKAATLDGARVIVVLTELEMGGAERQALLLSRYLAHEENAKVQIWGLGRQPGRVAEACEESGIPWRLVAQQWFGSRGERMKGLARLAFALRRARADIVLPYLILPNVVCGLVWRWAGARVCVWNQRDGSFTRLGPRAERCAVRQTPWFVSNSAHGAAFLTQTLRAPPERVRIINNGVQLAPPQADRATWRSRLGIDTDTVAACMIANLTRYKDHETLLRAWRRVVRSLQETGRSAVLLLAGRLDSSDSTHHASKALAYDLELGRSIRFLGEVQDVSGLLGAADLGVFSSRAESSPNGVLESMAAGLALAATDIPGVREAVGPGGYEFLAPPGDDGALADRILRLVAEPSLRAELGAANRLRIESEFSPRRMCEQTAAVIIEGLRGKTSAARKARGALGTEAGGVL
ncbi:MAG: glycosyltransferase [Acidobacteria bacterium]|nr:MAG: glycosyltransferase [Acidobacteriota bacterium]